MKKRSAVLLTLLICPGEWQSELACACDEGMIRDAAFDQPRDTYRLCVINRDDDAAGHDIAERLGSWLETTDAALNLETRFVAANDPEVRWGDYGLPAAPPELPVVVLVGKRPANPHNVHARQNFYIDHWQPEPTPAELQTLFSSPARSALRQELGRNLAVIVQVPGTSGRQEDTRQVVNSICQAGFGRQAWEVSSILVDRHDPRERLLLNFLGIRPEGPDWVGVVFGRGKFMTPPLTGNEITAAGIETLLATLAADCTCSQSPSRLGVDLLMRWEPADNRTVVHLAAETSAAEQTSTGDTMPVAHPPPVAAWFISPMARVTLWLFGGLIVFSGLGSAAIFWRHARRN